MSLAESIFDARSAKIKDKSGARFVVGPKMNKLSDVNNSPTGFFCKYCKSNWVILITTLLCPTRGLVISISSPSSSS